MDALNMTTLVYTGNNCQRCVQTYKLLDQYKVNYKTINVDDDLLAIHEIKSLGFTSLPVVVPNKNTGVDPWSGFDLLKIKQLAKFTTSVS